MLLHSSLEFHEASVKLVCCLGVLREEVVVFEGRINSLKRFKEDVREVVQGYECGIGLENFFEIHEGDTIEAYEIEEVARTEL